jgi:hypothetical protein
VAGLKLSVIIPVYNTEAFLAKCLDSMLIPDCRDYEIIAVNDGSTDGSRAILTEYFERFPGLIHPVDTPNGGLGHARNTGLSVAKGEWVLFVDSDDYLAPHAIPEIFEVLEKAERDSFDIAVFDFVHVNEEGKILASFSGCEKDEPFTLESFPEFLFSPMNAVNKLWRRSLFTENGISFPGRLWFEDLATSPKLYLHAGRIQPAHKAWYCYLQRRGSIMNSTAAERNAEMITVADSVLDYYRERGKWTQYRQQLEYAFFYDEFLTSVTRVNLIDPKSRIQRLLRDDYLKRFPDYRENPYFLQAPRKYRLLERLIRSGQWWAVHLLMTGNNIMKGR